MKGSGVIRYGLSGMLLAAVIAISIWLPGSMMQKAEDALVSGVYEESFNPADGGYKYSITEEEKRRLFTLFGREEAMSVPLAGPVEKDQLTMEQALDACEREMDKWVQLGILPESFASMEYGVDPQFLTVHDLEDSTLSYSFWHFQFYVYEFQVMDEKYSYQYFPDVEVYLDGYTGAICSFSMYGEDPVWELIGWEDRSIEKAVEAFSQYHGVELDTIRLLDTDYDTFGLYKGTVCNEDVCILSAGVRNRVFRLWWGLEGDADTWNW